jgi:hypothetical protein
MEPEGSLPCSEQPATGPHPEPVESTAHCHVYTKVNRNGTPTSSALTFPTKILYAFLFCLVRATLPPISIDVLSMLYRWSRFYCCVFVDTLLGRSRLSVCPIDFLFHIWNYWTDLDKILYLEHFIKRCWFVFVLLFESSAPLYPVLLTSPAFSRVPFQSHMLSKY